MTRALFARALFTRGVLSKGAREMFRREYLRAVECDIERDAATEETLAAGGRMILERIDRNTTSLTLRNAYGNVTRYELQSVARGVQRRKP